MPKTGLLNRLIEYEEQYDERRKNSCYYKMSHILFAILIGVACGLSKITEIHVFVEDNVEWFQSHLGEEFNVPCLTTFYNMLAMVNVTSLRLLFIHWVRDNHEVLKGVVCLDGKTLRGTKDKTQKATHIVSAFSAEMRIVLGQISCGELKSNEIKAGPELLRLLDISGSIVTVDAMCAQEEMAEEIIGQNADYVFVAKGNQEATREAIELGLYDFMHNGTVQSINIAYTLEEKYHGRLESKTALVCNDIQLLPAEIRAKWKSIAGFGAVFTTTRDSEAEALVETPTYFFYSVPDMTAKKLLQIKSLHWTIECNLHWSMDVQFREDASNIRKDRKGEVMNVLRHASFNLLEETPKLDKFKSRGTKQLKCLINSQCRDDLAKTAGSHGLKAVC